VPRWHGICGSPLTARSAHLILIRALVVAPAPLIAPFTSSQIIWALIAGYFVFGDLSDVWMLLGCTVIVASGLFVFYREAVLGGR
jgi:drug/metabolite transporter (DMT)-like permease